MEQWQEALLKAQESPRCGAKTRSKTSCKSPAMKNGRCRLHGGKSTGAPTGKEHGRYTHGNYTKDVLALNKHIKQIIRDAKQLMDEV